MTQREKAKKLCPICKGKKGFDDTTYDRTGVWVNCHRCHGTGLNLTEKFIKDAIEAALASPAPAGGEGRDEKAYWQAWAKKRIDIVGRHWLRAAKSALAGDMRELRNRVELAEAPPVDVVLSDVTPPPASPDVAGVVERLRTLIEYTVNPAPTFMSDRQALDWAHGQARLIEQEVSTLLESLSNERDELGGKVSYGWLYHNPDTGGEWSENHPIESGEVEDAENVRPATTEALHQELMDAWESWAEDRARLESLSADKARLEARLDARLPCDVTVAATRFSEGVKISTVLAAIERRALTPKEKA